MLVKTMRMEQSMSCFWVGECVPWANPLYQHFLLVFCEVAVKLAAQPVQVIVMQMSQEDMCSM